MKCNYDELVWKNMCWILLLLLFLRLFDRYSRDMMDLEYWVFFFYYLRLILEDRVLCLISFDDLILLFIKFCVKLSFLGILYIGILGILE